MKRSVLIALGALADACSSGPSERKSSIDERKERMQDERASAVDRDPNRVERSATASADDTADNADDEGALTPIDQSERSSDVEITQQIRKKVIDDERLSFTGKNVKIITVNGKVTLRGPVESAEERAVIERSARTVPGVERVENQLEVER